MRKGLVILGLGGLALICFALSAFGASTIPSKVFFDDSAEVTNPSNPNRDLIIFGHVTSPKADCLANRKIVILARYMTETGFRPYDVARTGANGGFNGVGPSTRDANQIDAAKLILKPKPIGTKKHPKTCAGDKVAV